MSTNARIEKIILAMTDSPPELPLDGKCDLVTDLEFDSLKILDLILELESEFDVKFEAEELVTGLFTTVDGINHAVDRARTETIQPTRSKWQAQAPVRHQIATTTEASCQPQPESPTSHALYGSQTTR